MKRKMLLIVLRYFWCRCRKYLLSWTFLFDSKSQYLFFLIREQFSFGEDPLYGKSALLDNRLM